MTKSFQACENLSLAYLSRRSSLNLSTRFGEDPRTKKAAPVSGGSFFVEDLLLFPKRDSFIEVNN